jgi:hypothetical protein
MRQAITPSALHRQCMMIVITGPSSWRRNKMETIKSIEDCTFSHLVTSGGGLQYDSEMDGFKITTDKQEILIGIQNEQNCCEDWGFFLSEDCLNYFIGSELLDIELVDDCWNVEKLKGKYGDKEDNYMFVNFITSQGVLQFTAYNNHNGYYGHYAVIKSHQLIHQSTL